MTPAETGVGVLVSGDNATPVNTLDLVLYLPSAGSGVAETMSNVVSECHGLPRLRKEKEAIRGPVHHTSSIREAENYSTRKTTS